MASFQPIQADASEDDIQDQIMLVQVLIRSLDQDADDYDQVWEEHQMELENCYRLLRRLQGSDGNHLTPGSSSASQHGHDHHPHSQESHTAHSSESFPHAWGPDLASPLAARHKNGSFLGNVGPADQSQKRNKHSLSLSGPQNEIKKFRGDARGFASPDSRLDSPISWASFDGANDEAAKPARHSKASQPSHGVFDRLLERQKMYERSLLASRSDEQLARTIQDSSASSPHPGYHSAKINGPATQAYLSRDGQIRRPDPPSPFQSSSWQPFKTEPSTSQDLFPSHSSQFPVKSETYTSQDLFGSHKRPHPDDQNAFDQGPSRNFRGLSKVNPIVIDDDDDISGMASSTLAPQYPRHHLNNFADDPGNGNAHLPYDPYQSLYTARQLANSIPTAGRNVYNAAANGLQNMTNAVFSNIGGAFTPTFPGYHNGLGVSGINGRGYSRPQAQTSLELALEERGLTSMLHDPTKSKEDLEALVANIRPDEEIPPEMRMNTPEQLRISLMEHQKLGLSWLQKQEESGAKGGILADDMGLGKTIQALALIATRPSTDPARRTTLIVAPVALLRQWQAEIEDKILPTFRLSSFIYHGPKSNITFAKLSGYDIVLTTYGKLSIEHRRNLTYEERRITNPSATRRPSERVVLTDEKSKWFRVILDEGQNIKNSNTNCAHSAARLRSKYRLVMTGTPMMNSVSDIYSLVKFLGIAPYKDHTKFNSTFRPLLDHSTYPAHRETAMKTLQAFLKSIMLRRTKTSKIDGKPILNLPPRNAEMTHCDFDEDQSNFYNALERQTQIQMNKYLAKGKSLKNYSYILVRLLRLRQACDHPFLIKDYAQEAYADMKPEEMEELARLLPPDVVERIKAAQGSFECPICYDGVANPSIFFPCGHDCCPECFARMTDASVNEDENGSRVAKCPQCRTGLDTKRIIDYRSFRKVHLQLERDEDDMDLEGLLPDLVEGGEDDDDDDDDSSEERDSDTDSQGDLRDFVVPDDVVDQDEVETASEEDAERVKDEDSAYQPKPSARVKGKGKARARTSGGKPREDGKKRTKDMSLAELRKEGMKNAAAKKKYLKRLRRQFVSSAKIEKTMDVVREIHERDPNEKILIFSQFTSFLDLLEIGLEDNNWLYRRYDGGMNSRQRNDAVLDFQSRTKNVKVMLVSLKAGNAGLNLTAASQVILLDPFWNPYVEDQAIDRAHRIGQTRPVQVHRILVQGTVEDRIIELQDKKRDMINMALDENAGKALSRLGRGELRFLFGLDPSPPNANSGD